ncbi:DinB family protein [Chloroflexota bacterium]
MAWKPAPKANPIGFIFWHIMRVEDNIFRGFQNKPSIWESEKWYEKLGMDAKVSGTGFDEEQIDKVALLPLSDLAEYAQQVAKSAVDYLSSLEESDLERAPDPNRPKRTIAVTFRAFVISHGWWHDGEIKYLKGYTGYALPCIAFYQYVSSSRLYSF